MFSMNITMTLIVLAFIPVILAYTAFFNLRIAKEFLRCDEAEGDLTVAVQENLTGVRVVRAFGREAFETARFDVKNKKLAEMWIKLGYTLGVYWGLGDVVSAAELLTVIASGTFLAATGKMSLGELLIFISYSQTIAWPVRQMGHVLSEMSKSGVSVRRVKEILDSPAEEEDSNALRPPIDRDIAFENVSFAYGGRSVLKNISFSCKPGETVGILGATGSGKSTLTYLLNRLYDLPEDSGRITVGGVDIREIDKYYLRRNIGIVLQEPFLYSRTLFENIDIGAQSGDLEAVRKSAEAACIGQDIEALPEKYDTMVIRSRRCQRDF
jgi:ATP-binding cassette subfamily B protein